ncbi:MAG: alanine--tRNA ligase [Deltaproteobacteria bacterium]|jgi:alanyl-tRNA synthetase|nr:alanine--tRNA ligase [Deltaproteobacteria bacterium]
MKATELRRRFLAYFEGLGHRRVASSPLIPQDDPTLLFTNAGMVQFKRVFTGEEKRDYNRATTSQKCVRAGGKHNDLENVGYTARHHTFFEMLGNFSFGDYFKSEAISFAWELLTKHFGLPEDRLYATIFQDDDEAALLWPKITGIPESRLIRLGEKDNFWAMGDTGPCGPCSEVLIDQGPELGCGRPDCAPGCDCDRYLEIWNLVFMQFERLADGTMTPLPKPSIDTGLGLERLAAVVQKVPSNFETDLFAPLLAKVAHLSGIPYVPGLLAPDHPSFSTNVSTRVIADHGRAITFLISDGARPENLGRGYVLRRVLRRAARHGRKLGLDKPFLSEIIDVVIETLKEAYPEIAAQSSHIKSLVKAEEERFGSTLTQGLTILNSAIEDIRAAGKSVLPGSAAFKLYDTYGFPLDLTNDAAREMGLTIDQDGFDLAMADQKAKGRAAWRSDNLANNAIQALVNNLPSSEFVGYDTLTLDNQTPALLIVGEKATQTATEGQEAVLVFPKTPFYAASGGQTGDVGQIIFPRGQAQVQQTAKAPGGVIVHHCLVTLGTIEIAPARLEVDESLRKATAANHSATHLLHRALRQTLGEHVRQAGSLVSPERLRFDFTHPSQPQEADLARVEEMVNGQIAKNWPIETQLLSYDEAVRSGAMALFEERYGEKVRVVNMGESRELCGGTHAQRAGDIGLFLVQAESAVAAGVRRLECLTGLAALKEIQKNRETLQELSSLLKARPEELTSRVQKQLERIQELAKAKPQENQADPTSLVAQAQTIGSVQVLAGEVVAQDPKDLRALADLIREKLGSSYLLALAAKAPEGKAWLLVAVSPQLTAQHSAGRLIGPMAEALGGRGGGQAQLAQAGGPNGSEIPKALAKFLEIVKKTLTEGQV